MRRISTLIFILLAYHISGSLSVCHAQLASEGEWKATTIDRKTSPDTNTPVIKLTGDVTIKGCITISSGFTLIIENDSDSPVTLSKKFNSGTLFSVNNGGHLIIRGNEGKEIIVDCGANLTWNDYTLTKANPSYTSTHGITNAGVLDLSYVTLQNFLATNSYNAALNVTSSKGTTTLNHCTIKNCQSGAGAAMYLSNSSASDPEETRVMISNSTITQCVTGNSPTNNSGGAIRTLGNSKANLYLINVTFSYNSSLRNPGYDNSLVKSANGGALFWNGRGHANTTCYIDGCLFEYNKCENNGGAIKAQGSLIFRNNKTIIRHNQAPYGAGIFIEGYTGSVSLPKPSNITYALNEYLEVTDNIATSYIHNGVNNPSKGGGIHFDFGSDMKLEANSTVTVEMAGAIIMNNHVVGEGGLGGGIFYEDAAPSAKKYKFNINLNHGMVMLNTASLNGGGIYVSKGEVKSQKVGDNTLLVDQNVAALNGGGIYIKNGSLSLADGIITQNTLSSTGNGGGICIEDGDFTISDGSVSNNIISSGVGAGVYIVGSNGKGNFTMNGGEIKGNNTNGNNGGGVYINGGNFTLNAGSITENESVDGGGVYLNNGNFELVNGEISKNTVTGNGGGVYLIGENCIYKLKNGSIYENIAENGGGVYLANGSFILADSLEDQGSISKNTSHGYGGGVYIAGEGDFTMNGGTVEDNVTSGEDGGGIYLDGGNFILNEGYIQNNSAYSSGGGVYLFGGRFLMEDGVISGNVSRSNGGGACIGNNGDFVMNDGDITGNGKISENNVLTQNGGGVFIDGGSLTVTSGIISGNSSIENGGGVYIMNGTVNMGAGMIKENHCGLYGGGLYVFNSSADAKTVDFNGGTLVGNSAMYGGGVCVNGRIDLNIGNVEIAENSATNGGGVCLMNNAFMNFGVGQIKNNTAMKQSSRTYNTAYGLGIDQVEGFGGGVYLDSDTKLVFSYAADLGLFGNKADTGGNEIFANGDDTLVDLPDVTYMALGGYPGASNLKWIEDYPTNDPNYYRGTKLKSSWDEDQTNLRYEETISQNAYIYNLSGAVNQSEKYICFALGYEVIYITITRFGLQKGESAVFHLRKNDANDFKVIITGDGSESITKKVAVTAGEWTIQETDWTWTYEITDENGTELPDRKIVRDIADENNRLFVFRGTSKTSLPLHHESISINVMGN